MLWITIIRRFFQYQNCINRLMDKKMIVILRSKVCLVCPYLKLDLCIRCVIKSQKLSIGLPEEHG